MSHPILALERLKERAEEIEKKQEQNRVHCPECDTTVWEDSVEEAVETADEHDESRHDGEPTTQINGIVPPQFTEEEKEQTHAGICSMVAEDDRDV